jgi:hypothetical protein
MRINKIVTSIAMLCTIIFSTGFTTLVTKVDGPQKFTLLDEWITLLDGAGWEQHQRDGWISFHLPTVASECSSKVFQIWNKDSHRITLLVKRNTSVNALPNVYNLRIYIDIIFQLKIIKYRYLL